MSDGKFGVKFLTLAVGLTLTPTNKTSGLNCKSQGSIMMLRLMRLSGVKSFIYTKQSEAGLTK